MGGHDCTATSCRVLAHEPHQRGAMREVHPARGLVQQEQLGRERKGRRNGDPLSLTDRAIPRITIREVEEVESRKHLLGDSQVAPERAWPEQDLVAHGVAEQRAAWVLGYEGDERLAFLPLRDPGITPQRLIAGVADASMPVAVAKYSPQTWLTVPTPADP